MRYIIIFCFATICFADTHAALQDKQREKGRCVVIPAERSMLAVASQPDSPLAFEDAKSIICTNGHSMNSYKLRNRSTKPIRSFTLAGWTSHATGYKWGWGATSAEELIMLGQLAPMKEQEIEIVPLTKELREKLKLEGPMQGVIILMVVNVEYADGTSYNGEAVSKALEDYFELVGGKVH